MSQGCEAEHLCLGFGWEGGLALGEEGFFPRGDGGGSGSRGIPCISYTQRHSNKSSRTTRIIPPIWCRSLTRLGSTRRCIKDRHGVGHYNSQTGTNTQPRGLGNSSEILAARRSYRDIIRHFLEPCCNIPYKLAGDCIFRDLSPRRRLLLDDCASTSNSWDISLIFYSRREVAWGSDSVIHIKL